jgi:hypothetical protein
LGVQRKLRVVFLPVTRFQMNAVTLHGHPDALSKREVIEIPLGKHEPLLSPKLNLVCVDGEPHKSTGPASTPGVVRGADELANRQGFLPAIDFHS